MKIIIYFVTANVWVLAISLVALYWLSSKTLLNEIGDHSQSLLINGSKNTAQLMEWSINYAYSSSSDVQLESYALSEEHTDFETYTVWSRLMNVKNGNPSIDSVYLINDYTQNVIDSRLGLSSFEEFYDQEVLQRLRARKITDGVFLIPRIIHLPLSSETDKRVITAIIPYETGKSISAFVLNVDADSIMTLLQNNSSFLDTHLFVLNDKNELVFSTIQLNNGQILDFSDATQSDTNGWHLYKPKEQDELMLVYAKTSINGIQNWRFFETIPKSVILSKIILLRNLTFLIFICLFIASVWAIIFLSRKVYSPIQELVQNVTKQHHSEMQDRQLESNELVYLSNVFISQFEKINELSEYERQNKFLARERFIRELLGGSAQSITDIRKTYQELELDIPEENLAVVIFRIDHFMLFTKKYTKKDSRLLRFALANIIGESLQPTFSKQIHTVDMGTDHIAVLVPVDKGQSAAFLAESLRESQRLVLQYLSLSTTIACGRYLEGLVELHEGYLAAYEMTQERFRLGHGSLVMEELVDETPNELYQMPIELDRQMAQAFQKTDISALLELMDQVLTSLKVRPYFECKMSLITFFMHIRRSLQETPYQLVLSSSWGLTSLENQIIDLETLQAVGQWMKNLSSQALEELAIARNTSKKSGLVDEVDHLIEMRLTDVNLTTKVLADELGLSVNYLRNLYKVETKRSITEMISERRLDIICEELVSSDDPIESIIQKYGFISLNTFYVAFKKKYGMTPALYRKTNRSDSINNIIK
jgi:AraC-like DNA-binding protein/GGDEF domain-containing protein